LANVLTSKELLLASISLISTILLLFYLRPLQGFALVVFEILAMGFWLSGQAYLYNWDNYLQISAIIKHITIMLSIIVSWLLIMTFKNLLTDYKQTNEQLSMLKKYVDDIGILTYKEFVYQIEILHTAMRRRRESGFIIVINIDLGKNKFALESIYDVFSKATLSSIRKNYDLAGKKSQNEIIIFLQNTNIDGCNIVVNRFKELLKSKIDISEDLYKINCIELSDKWEEVEQIIEHGIRGEIA
jgi:hypothetical protein